MQVNWTRHPFSSKEDFELPDHAWTKLNLAWVGFFVFAGALNIYVAYSFEESVWVNFKLFGLFGITFVFLVLQTLWLSRYMPDEEEQNKEET